MTASPVRQWKATRLGLAAAGLVLCLASTALLPAAGAEPPPPAQTVGVPIPEGQIERAVERLDSLAEALLEKSGIPGLAVAVVHGGQTVYARGFGLRRVGEPAAVDAQTVFQIASLSKPVGATVIARQVGEGLVAWDSRMAELLPWFRLSDPWVSDQLTLGDLYAHRSGLPDHAGDLLEDLGYDRRAVLERLRLLPLGPFRNSYAYTNFGMTAAAEAVATAAGTDWATLSEQALYGPLGMTRSSSRFADYERRENRAHGHVPVEGGYAARYQRQADAQSPAGGVSSTAEDFARWMSLVLQEGVFEGEPIVAAEALLPAVTAQVISGPSYAPDARPSFYGYGFGVGIEPSGRTLLSHSGAFALGWATTFRLIPSAGVGIAVFSNAAPVGVVEALASEFTDLVQYGEVTRDWYAGYSRLMAGLMAPLGALAGQEPPAEPAPPAALDDYLGRYDSAYFGEAAVELDGEGLALLLGTGPARFALRHWDGDSFVFAPSGENAPEGTLSEVRFRRVDGALADALTIELLDGDGLGRFDRRP